MGLIDVPARHTYARHARWASYVNDILILSNGHGRQQQRAVLDCPSDRADLGDRGRPECAAGVDQTVRGLQADDPTVCGRLPH